ncbi:MAG: hypothetical protein KA099_08565 [Alphaproteobacteria bacterium]|nr:hypothetical protein [Alphaproteobacteria bacterium]MBP7759951.1 hypothetical protein [Alphaproteobacteria bacterium]MBP7763305.1 hypothetical protein [Alphaproteobacteria bacterium]MBP7905361.1 hypothetical protein [Alphaproteobacteria bacterium]
MKNSTLTRILLNLFATILLTIVGIWGSYALDAILQNPFSENIEVRGFYVLVFIFVVFFTWLLYSTEQDSIEAQKRLISKSDELKEAIRTLPPEGFLNLFSEKYDEAHALYKALLHAEGKFTKQEIELSIRGILIGILRLTEFFDRGSENQSYGANIMIFTDAYKKDENYKPELKVNLKFANEDVDMHKLKGVLYLKHELSTSTKCDNSEIDTDLQPIKLALPVPFEAISSKTRKFKALPGAPLAVALNSPNLYADASTVADWVKTEGDFNETIEAEIRDYFSIGLGKDIKSFCSIPLVCDGAEPIAVLNLHKNATEMFSRKDQFAIYTKIMQPFLSMLAELVNKLYEPRP